MSAEKEKAQTIANNLSELLQNVGLSGSAFALRLAEQSGDVVAALMACGEGFSQEVFVSMLDDLQIPRALTPETIELIVLRFLEGEDSPMGGAGGSGDAVDERERPHFNEEDKTWTCVCTMRVPLTSANCFVCDFFFERVLERDEYKEANPDDDLGPGDEDYDDDGPGSGSHLGGSGSKEGVYADYSDADGSWRVNLPEDKSQADLETVDETRREQFRRLKAFFLSPEFGARLQREEESAAEKSSEALKSSKVIKESEARAFAHRLIPEIDSFLDRRNEGPALDLVMMTLKSGLPLYQQFPAVQQHTIRSMQFIFDQLMNHVKESIARSYLQRLVDSFRACQAEQARVIDSIYGSLSGRDKTFPQQLLNLVDDHKERILEQTALSINPSAVSQDDSVPQKQLPHIRSTYRMSAGFELGLGHMESAKADYCKFRICAEHRQLVIDTYQRLFLLHDLLDVFVNDVNQQDAEAERLIDLNLLTKWAGNKDENNGFDAYSIYYDETQPKLYNDAKPLEQNAYQPFLSRYVALDIFCAVFLQSPSSSSSGSSGSSA